MKTLIVALTAIAMVGACSPTEAKESAPANTGAPSKPAAATRAIAAPAPASNPGQPSASPSSPEASVPPAEPVPEPAELPVPAGVESVVKALIPPGFVAREPERSRVGKLPRRSYFIHKAGEPDEHSFYPAPIILVETLDGRVVTHEKVGPAWGWTGVRVRRSAGLGDPHHTIELREFDNGTEARILGFMDGETLKVNRGAGKLESFSARPDRNHEVQLATIGPQHALIEISGQAISVFMLNGTTFTLEPALTELARSRGLKALPDYSLKWTSAQAGSR